MLRHQICCPYHLIPGPSKRKCRIRSCHFLIAVPSGFYSCGPGPLDQRHLRGSLSERRRVIDLKDLRQNFRTLYGAHALICRAPGRVNLIGEHTDYNDGFVMPVAIDSFTCTAMTPRKDSQVNLSSAQSDAPVSTLLSEDLPPRHDWSDYVIGVMQQLHNARLVHGGADVLVYGEVPIGAGLSSSAALEVSTGFAALRSNGAEVDRTQLALLCQRAENQFVGVKCGIMDQFVSCHGKAGHALVLDCRSLEFSLVPLPSNVQIVICNTMVKHQLGDEYNARREQCEAGVRLLSQWLPGILALRDVTAAQLQSYANRLPPAVYRRCRHVVSENARVLQAAEALRQGALQQLAPLMAESHRSLRDDYEVSCRELDTMVELASKQPGVFGARMTGGGFGGCTVNLVEAEQAESFAKHMRSEYQNATGITPEVYVCTAADGACEVH